MSEKRFPKIGESVIFHDTKGVARDALITVVHGKPSIGTSIPCVNLLVVADDESKIDQYGRQIERWSSVVHKTMQSAHGFYFRWVDEEPNPVADVTT